MKNLVKFVNMETIVRQLAAFIGKLVLMRHRAPLNAPLNQFVGVHESVAKVLADSYSYGTVQSFSVGGGGLRICIANVTDAYTDYTDDYTYHKEPADCYLVTGDVSIGDTILIGSSFDSRVVNVTPKGVVTCRNENGDLTNYVFNELDKVWNSVHIPLSRRLTYEDKVRSILQSRMLTEEKETLNVINTELWNAFLEQKQLGFCVERYVVVASHDGYTLVDGSKDRFQ